MNIENKKKAGWKLFSSASGKNKEYENDARAYINIFLNLFLSLLFIFKINIILKIIFKLYYISPYIPH